mgnify:CR=1 FL=1
MRGVVEKIPAADVQILGELVHGVDVLLSGKYGYIPDFDSLPNDVKDKLKKGIYTLGEVKTGRRIMLELWFLMKWYEN